MLVATPTLDGTYSLGLFNHIEDPLLATNLIDKEPEVVEELAPILDTWHAELNAANSPVAERSKEEEEALRQLGYIE